jgi:hypothetical protein
MAKPSPAFKKMASQVGNGLVLVPILQNYLNDAKYPKKFSIDFANHGGERKPDGYFHPSTHPLVPARKLYYYLTEPDKIDNEPLEFMGALSTTMGTAIHGFVQMCLKDTGVLVDDEVFVIDHETGSRGSMDGVLNLPTLGETGLEFKTSNQMKLQGLHDNDIETFKTKWPVYYAQVQEYMRLSGLRKFVVLFLSMGYPWTMKEVLVPFDQGMASMIETKYRGVRAAAASGEVPPECCSPFSKESQTCPMRRVCPVGQMSLK